MYAYIYIWIYFSLSLPPTHTHSLSQWEERVNPRSMKRLHVRAECNRKAKSERKKIPTDLHNHKRIKWDAHARAREKANVRLRVKLQQRSGRLCLKATARARARQKDLHVSGLVVDKCYMPPHCVWIILKQINPTHTNIYEYAINDVDR